MRLGHAFCHVFQRSGIFQEFLNSQRCWACFVFRKDPHARRLCSGVCQGRQTHSQKDGFCSGRLRTSNPMLVAGIQKTWWPGCARAVALRGKIFKEDCSNDLTKTRSLCATDSWKTRLKTIFFPLCCGQSRSKARS